MMSFLTSTTLALGFFANVALAGGYTNAELTTTETQEIGSTTSEGAIWYSMNVCEIVQHTQCDVSLSSGGAAPPIETGDDQGNYPPPPGPGEPSAPGSDGIPAPSGEQPPPPSGEPVPSEGPKPTDGDKPAPTVLTTTNEAEEETTVPGTLVPATTDEDASADATSGSATAEPSSTSTEGAALALSPAAIPAAVYGAMALLLIAV